MFLLQLYNIWCIVHSTSTFYLPNQSSYPLTPISLQEHELLIEISSKFWKKRTKSQQHRKVLRTGLGEIEIVMSDLHMICWPQQHSNNKLAQRVGPQEPDSNFGKHRGERNTLNDMTPGKFRMLGISAGWPTWSLQQEKKEDYTSLLLLLFSCQVMSDSATPWTAAHPGLSVLHLLPEFTQVHVHWIGDAIKPSHPWLPPSPFAFNLSQHQGIFQWIGSSN